MWRNVARAYSVATPLKFRGLQSSRPSRTAPFFAGGSAAAAAAVPNPSWASVHPSHLNDGHGALYHLPNLVAGEWTRADAHEDVVDPLTGATMLRVPLTSERELTPFLESLAAVPKAGLHNPFKHPERYVQYGDISAKVAQELRHPAVADFFARLIQRVVPKSYAQAMAEVSICRTFMENFSGDQVRFLARGFTHPGNHYGQMTHGLRWPYGAVALVTPFNFPLEVLQLMGALYMGNKVVVKNHSFTSVVTEQWVRLLHHCGMPTDDVDIIHSEGPVMGELLRSPYVRMTQFTGSSRVAEHLAVQLRGKIRVEDAGFDWKLLGPDVHDVSYVAWQCDQDAYACSGQKCSAQSMLFMHRNWRHTQLLAQMEFLARRRTLEDLTVGPVLTITTSAMQRHVQQLLSIPGAELLWGGEELPSHSIPAKFGALQPTAVFVPLAELVKPQHFELCTTEIFGPLQVVTEYEDEELTAVLAACERMEHHLTAAIVSNDVAFQRHVLANTVNGTTYVGARARTTGAPQNHFFGPAGDPRGAGIGTPEAIQAVWSCHREIVTDCLIPPAFQIPDAS